MTYIYVPFRISKHKTLTDRDKLIICFIGGFFGGECHASNDYIGTVLGVSGRTISRNISSLVKRGYVSRRNILENKQVVGRVLTLRKFQDTFDR